MRRLFDQSVLFLTEVMNVISSVPLREFGHPSSMRLIASKLPSYLQDRWMREEDDFSRGAVPFVFRTLVGYLLRCGSREAICLDIVSLSQAAARTVLGFLLRGLRLMQPR